MNIKASLFASPMSFIQMLWITIFSPITLMPLWTMFLFGTTMNWILVYLIGTVLFFIINEKWLNYQQKMLYQERRNVSR
jgi:uncharacterized membrane protein (DUF106 family)